MENSRTHNVIRNISWAIPLQVVLMLLQFVARTFFVRQLGREYLGINGLFTDIICVLDLANLRIPDAIIISMYKPLAEKNNEKVRALLYLIGKAYSIIGLVVMGIGLLLIPLLPVLIKDPPDIPVNFTIIYLFYLFQAVFTYYISYRKSIVFADQKNYIITIYQNIINFIRIILQIVILITIRNFYLFLAAQVICILAGNFLISRKAERMYPFIKEKNNYKLSKDDIAEIISNIKSMFIIGIGFVTLEGIDSILVSSIIGIGILGLCSNYILIIISVKTLIEQALNGFTASIGNLNAKEDMQTIEKTFYEFFFIVFFIFAFCAINLAVSLNTLITNWFGNSFLLSQAIVITLVLRFYIQGTQYVTYTFRSTLGLLKKRRFIPLVSAFVNITLSVLLGRFYGAVGIFLASSIAVFFFTILPEAQLIYKEKFGKSIFKFIFIYLGYLLFIVGNYFITNMLLNNFTFTGWIGFLAKASLGAFISGLLFIIVFFKNRNFRSICSRLLYIIKSRRNLS